MHSKSLINSKFQPRDHILDFQFCPANISFFPFFLLSTCQEILYCFLCICSCMSVLKQMAFSARALTVLKIVVWLSLISKFLIVSNGIEFESEREISCLKSEKDSLEDPFNYLASWNFGSSSSSAGFICKFTGIDCWKNDENNVLNIRLSDMGLKGRFPRGIANCSALKGLDLSRNNLFGTIPSDISKLLPYVTSLDLSGNSFSGEIPRDISNLSYLNFLKLDDNRLTGQIPPELGLLGPIRSFSVANNCLSGPVPDFGSASVNAESYSNNKGLCGGPLKRYKAPPKNFDRAFFSRGFAVGWSVSAVVVFSLTFFYLPINPLLKKKIMSIRKKMKKKKRNQQLVQRSQWPSARNIIEDKISKLAKFVTRMSFTELVNVTHNFREDNIIGLGKTWTMYKAVCPNGSFLAIKRFFDLQCSWSEGQFLSEVMTLGRLRHTNLVPLIGFCYETKDRVNRLLVYKYMSNGNLYDWLHPPGCEIKVMHWPVRVKIAVGLARGLAWLHHHDRRFRVFHQNISSKCVLLDQNFEPKIFDFGEAKFMNANDTAPGGSPFTNGELLELGFDLLELGFDKNDVYSFGLVLLELVTGKEPRTTTIDEASANSDSSLVEWIINLVSTSFCLHDVVDNSLIGLGFDGEISEFLSIACKCVQSLPEQRPTMLEVYRAIRAIGEKHGLVHDFEMSRETEIVTASEGDVEIIE